MLLVAACGTRTGTTDEVISMGTLRITSTAFTNMKDIPSLYTCQGGDINPALKIESIPPGTKSLALIMDDPDAPMGTWVHWVMWNIPRIDAIKEDSVPTGAVQGLNSWPKNSYGGPCPPSGPHRYFFKLYALNTTLDLPGNAGKQDLEKAMQGHILDKAELIGLYRKR